MEIVITGSYEDMSAAAAQAVARLLNAKPDAVLGLAAGEAAAGMYGELARLHREQPLDFSQVTTFNLTEYVHLAARDRQSDHFFMQENFFRHVNIPPQNINIPSGTTDNYRAFCAWYEQRIAQCGGIDLLVVGLGDDGHIGFNEPVSSLGSRTRLKTLESQVVRDSARLFDRPQEAPAYAITMGVGTILDARQILLLASGAAKAGAVAAVVEGPVTSMVTASALQMHPCVTVLLDDPAAGKLKLRGYYQWVQQNKPGAPRA